MCPELWALVTPLLRLWGLQELLQSLNRGLKATAFLPGSSDRALPDPRKVSCSGPHQEPGKTADLPSPAVSFRSSDPSWPSFLHRQSMPWQPSEFYGGPGERCHGRSHAAHGSMIRTIQHLKSKAAGQLVMPITRDLTTPLQNLNFYL